MLIFLSLVCKMFYWNTYWLITSTTVSFLCFIPSLWCKFVMSDLVFIIFTNIQILCLGKDLHSLGHLLYCLYQRSKKALIFYYIFIMSLNICITFFFSIVILFREFCPNERNTCYLKILVNIWDSVIVGLLSFLLCTLYIHVYTHWLLFSGFVIYIAATI